MVLPPRAAGILLHPTSLPGRYGIGDLGPAASDFLDWLVAAGQTVWQVLPLGPTGMGNSPYGCLSAFAGNPLLVSPERLFEESLLAREALALGEAAAPPATVDFESVAAARQVQLRASWDYFRAHAPAALREELAAFLTAPEQSAWLADWTLFAAVKGARGELEWTTWERDLRLREPAAMAAARAALASEIEYQGYVQFLFFRQWRAVRAAASERGIRILGDLPIYVAPDSADLWAHPELFELDAEGLPIAVAGVPPDYFSATGQLWGNPLYRWRRMQADDFAWWVERLRANLRLADFVRLDHFRGFAAYWRVPAGAPTAQEGQWTRGPGERLFAAFRAALGELPLVAENLGVITPDVEALRRAFDLPGMKVLQFAFSELDCEHAPHRLEPRTVVYTGTHDNDTARGWFEKLGELDRDLALDYLGGRPETIEWDLIRAAYTSVAELAIVPLQDVLGLGSEARMNTPGRADGNWGWRVDLAQVPEDAVLELRRLAEVTARLPRPAGAATPAAVEALAVAEPEPEPAAAPHPAPDP